MRVILVGTGSFIAQAVIDVCRSSGIDYASLRHNEKITDATRENDCIMNFAFDPHIRGAPYAEEKDWDLKAARVAVEKKARFVMLSTRRVYPSEKRWNAVEDYAAIGDETLYGQNKAASEVAVLQACGGNGSIFRLSNIFGYEYNSGMHRKSFLGQLLSTLKQQNKIFFDMDPQTQRDFLPVEICARLLVARVIDGTTGIYNLGSGVPIACGTLAKWVMEGFEAGELICDPMTVKDEFFLNMNKWRRNFELPVDEKIVQTYCVELGRKLKCEKS
jgi:nucleoside-diphosphate-sugar epimerase